MVNNDEINKFEKKIEKIILYPIKDRIILKLRDHFKVPENKRLRDYVLKR